MVYVALGDSTGVGVGAVAGGGYPERLAARLQRAGKRVRLVNLSVSGATAADLRRHQLVGVERAGPSLVTVAIGANDIGHGRSEQDFARDLEVVGAHLAELGVPIVAANIPDVALVPAAALVPPAMLARIERFNAAIRRVAHRYHWRLVDLYTRSREALSQGAWSLLSADGFHPSDEGYERWADAMWPAVEGALAVQP